MPTYLLHNDNYWVCDIEADGLLEDATRIWVACVENINTGVKHAFTDKESFKKWLGRLPPDYCLVGHNIMAYDVPMLNRHWGTRIPVRRCVDTFILSMLYNPAWVGGHSLEAWGTRLKFPKGNFNDFSRLSDEMVAYCQNDVTLCRRIYTRLTERMRQVGFTEEGAEIEHLSWNIIQNKQRRHGFPFDKQKAEILHAELCQREEELRTEIHKLWPPRLCPLREYPSAYKKDGQPTALYQRHCEQYPRVELLEGGGYRTHDWVSFNLGSPQQRIKKLLELGWTPTRYTKKGNPQVDEEELNDFAEKAGIPELSALAKWLMVSSRMRMVRTWLDAYNEKTGAIHGRLFINSTLRYRHSNPNSANVPAVKVDAEGNIKYGEEGTWAYECRALYTSGDPLRFSLVGVDAKGIQLRVLANYAFSDTFVESVLAGDPHTNNIKVLGLANKAAAKKFLYTTLMGGGGAKLAADQGQFGTRLTAKQGNELKGRLIDAIPGFRELINRLQAELSSTGRIKLCDGTPILVPSDHMVIPYLLQGDESRIMKKASIFLDEEIRKQGLVGKVWKVADIHDEWQFVVCHEVLEQFMALAKAAFIKTGEYFGYRLPIEGDAKEGLTWAETH
jgi:DNA polymerase-1